jgi:transglutaminase-like putative cysteine protease
MKKITHIILAMALIISMLPALTASALGNTKAEVNVENLNKGIVAIRYVEGKDTKVKVRITGPDKVAYDYNLKSDKTFENFPLTAGDGEYTISIFTLIADAKYAQAFTTKVEVKLEDINAPFLLPSQYVNYTTDEKSKVSALAAELVKDKATELEKVNAIYDYVVKNFNYDNKLAKTVQGGYIPNIDIVLEKKTGICFDYSAALVALLRSQKIPTKLQIGYAGETYHAWISIYSSKEGWLDNYIAFDGKSFSRADPTYDSSGKQSTKVREYIVLGNNYTTKFTY